MWRITFSLAIGLLVLLNTLTLILLPALSNSSNATADVIPSSSFLLLLYSSLSFLLLLCGKGVREHRSCPLFLPFFFSLPFFFAVVVGVRKRRLFGIPPLFSSFTFSSFLSSLSLSLFSPFQCITPYTHTCYSPDLLDH